MRGTVPYRGGEAEGELVRADCGARVLCTRASYCSNLWIATGTREAPALVPECVLSV